MITNSTRQAQWDSARDQLWDAASTIAEMLDGYDPIKHAWSFRDFEDFMDEVFENVMDARRAYTQMRKNYGAFEDDLTSQKDRKDWKIEQEIDRVEDEQ